MADPTKRDAVVIGSGPNGLGAALALARADCAVTVFEAKETVGGGSRSAELTLPGFVHDVCSAVHPLAVASPFFRMLPLEKHGLSWVHPEAPLAHPLDDGTAVVLERSVEATADGLGHDAAAYRRMMTPLVRDWDSLASQVLAPLVRVPRHPLVLSRFGLRAVRSARALGENTFKGERARALFAGLAAHAILPLEQPFTATFGLLLGAAAHAVGWPMAHGGSQSIVDALASYFRSLGGEIVTGRMIESLDELPPARAFLLDITPRQVLRIAGRQLSDGYRRTLGRYRYGPGVFKVDLALEGPIPWRAEECRRAGTVHVGGTSTEIAASERAVAKGEHPERPYVLVAQPSLFDPARAPEGKHTVWAYCHVPNGSTRDMTERIEAQIERFAPGFRERVLARHVMSPEDLERYNENYVGGDIAGGAHDGLQLFLRPAVRATPYATSAKGIYICSSSTPPGAGVHGMCGYWAARAALRGSLANHATKSQ